MKNDKITKIVWFTMDSLFLNWLKITYSDRTTFLVITFDMKLISVIIFGKFIKLKRPDDVCPPYAALILLKLAARSPQINSYLHNHLMNLFTNHYYNYYYFHKPICLAFWVTPSVTGALILIIYMSFVKLNEKLNHLKMSSNSLSLCISI